MNASFGFAQRYFSIPPAAILNETPDNFFVDNNVTSEVKIKVKDIMRTVKCTVTNLKWKYTPLKERMSLRWMKRRLR